MTVQLLEGDARAVLATLPAEIAHVVTTSPPYYGLRSYGTTPQRWGGDPDHDHQFVEVHPHGWRKNDSHPGKLQRPGNQHRERLVGGLCACGCWEGELGLEPTPDLFVEHLVEVFRAVKRVLHPTGTIWVNLGDSYASHAPNNGEAWRGSSTLKDPGRGNSLPRPFLHKAGVTTGIPRGNVLGVPWLFALAMRADGWILRAEITWCKAAPMPESVQGWRWERHWVKLGNRGGRRDVAPMPGQPPRSGHSGEDFYADAVWAPCPGCPKCSPNDGLVLRKGKGRPTSATEKIFVFSREHSYYYDTDAVREPHKSAGDPRNSPDYQPKRERNVGGRQDGYTRSSGPMTWGPGGRNMLNYWVLGPEPTRFEHHATYPTEIPKRAILAGSSTWGCCPRCRYPWARVVERHLYGDWHPDPSLKANGVNAMSKNGREFHEAYQPPTTLGWRPTCRCDAGQAVPCTVLDPFAGTATTLLVADRHGRDAIGIELLPEYAAMGRRRLAADARPLFSQEAVV